jgi:hypothetical protein
MCRDSRFSQRIAHPDLVRLLLQNKIVFGNGLHGRLALHLADLKTASKLESRSCFGAVVAVVIALDLAR